MLTLDKRILTHFDYVIIALIAPIVIFSFVLINEMSSALAIKQSSYVGISLLVAAFVFMIPFRDLGRGILIFYWICIFLLILTEFVGDTRLGAQRWLEIPLIGFTIQPSEVVKIALLLLLALKIKESPPPPGGYGVRSFAKLSLYILIPVALILKQPDLGTAMIVIIIGFGVLFLVGVNYKIWVVIALVVGLLSPIIYGNLHDYQKKRIKDFIADDVNYHVKQSQIAIGSGGFIGKSKEDATQAQLKFLPIATSDFIFAYLVERFGFLGGIGLMLVYLLLIIHILSLSFVDSKDNFLRVFAGGIAIMFFIYTFINIGMTIGLSPVVGVPLPMFSYGGSSFFTFMILIAILENLLAFRFELKYNSIFNLGRGPLAQLVRVLGS